MLARLVICACVVGMFPFSALLTQLPPSFSLVNPSFEGAASDATLPLGWVTSTKACTPDILPGYWGVYQEAEEGDTYLGLITRPDGSWEAIAQALPRTLYQGECYRFSVALAHSRTYSGYNGALKLRVYGGKHRQDRSYLLYESSLVDHSFWKTYLLQFTLAKDIRYLIFEAYHKDPPFSYSGNILLDNISPIVACPRA